MAVKMKICGLSRKEDISYANALKPDFIGFVFAKKSRRYVDPKKAAQLRRLLDPGIIPVGVFVNEDPKQVADLLKQGIIEIAQLHGQEDETYLLKLKKRTDKPLIQAFQIDGAEDVKRAEKSAADYILLDHGAGGTGETFDWSLLGQISRPYFLAGGLNPGNVKNALELTKPYALDVSSGVETDKVKDFEKMKAFAAAVREIAAAQRRSSEGNKTVP